MPRSSAADMRYQRVARVLREAIAGMEPGEALPPEGTIAYEHNVGRATVQVALRMLEAEGLIERRVGRTHAVRARPAVVREPLPPGAEVYARLATDAERDEHDLPDGAYVQVITYKDGSGKICPADRTVIVSA